MRNLAAAATRMPGRRDIDDNAARAEALVQRAAEDGAQVFLLEELVETP
ncbi:hypothetical protein LNKW23_46300 [Paralimibaculum aggregatum]|uniref:Uncharacterized protein n=1 Tax=Paralimibaculum aggregatum TaxID=3036245 RepID=A0ABQ6LTL3_9RHOB|nr:hypothetical protein [Limibaculum sp. NKW23]GMG85410.1 hypothetical protein LNKW23_46300 [Limibaculum sp. NKW23]